MHPLHLVCERLGPTWSTFQPTPTLVELVRLHAMIEPLWLANPIPSQENVSSDVEVSLADFATEPTIAPQRMFSELCVSIAVKLGVLSPILSDLFLRQAICSVSHILCDDDKQPVPLHDVMRAGQLLGPILSKPYDDPAVLLRAFGMDALETIQELAVSARDLAESDTTLQTMPGLGEVTLALPSESAIRFRDCARSLARSCRPVAAYLEDLMVEGDDFEGDFLGQTFVGARLRALRRHALAVYQLYRGELADAERVSDEGFRALSGELQQAGIEVSDWDRVQAMKLMAVVVEARAAREEVPVLTEAAYMMIRNYTSGVDDDWLDGLNGDSLEWFNETFVFHLVARMLALSHGSLRPHQASPDRLFETSFASLQNTISVLQQQVITMSSDVGDVLSKFAFDVRRESAFVESLLRNWNKLSQDTQNRIVLAEQEYRAFGAPDTKSSPRAVATHFFDALAIQAPNFMARVPAIPYASDVKELRNRWAHPEEYEFAERQLSELRAFLLGIGMDRGGILDNLVRPPR